jgi:hypothetical protein
LRFIAATAYDQKEVIMNRLVRCTMIVFNVVGLVMIAAAPGFGQNVLDRVEFTQVIQQLQSVADLLSLWWPTRRQYCAFTLVPDQVR